MNINSRELGTVALKASFPSELFYGKYLHLFYLRLLKKEKREKDHFDVCFSPIFSCEMSLARIICQYLETE